MTTELKSESKTTFVVEKVSFFAQKDHIEEGCDPEQSYRTSYEYNFESETLAGLLDQLSEHALWKNKADPNDYELDVDEESGRIEFSGMYDSNWSPANEKDIELWKKGEKELWYGTHSFRVVQRTESIPVLSDIPLDS